MNDQDDDWFHEKYIEIVSQNWTMDRWNLLATDARKHFFDVIFKADGAEGAIFVRLWQQTWTLVEEVRLTGEATSIISHPYDQP